jgi:hypothetical protein
VLLATQDIAATHEGPSCFRAMNAMASAALAIGLDIDLDDIRVGLRRHGEGYMAASLCSKREVSRAQA